MTPATLKILHNRNVKLLRVDNSLCVALSRVGDATSPRHLGPDRAETEARGERSGIGHTLMVCKGQMIVAFKSKSDTVGRPFLRCVVGGGGSAKWTWRRMLMRSVIR